jgi:hypothetical protein
MMIGLAKQNLTSTAVNTETNETATNIKNVSIVPEATWTKRMVL